MNAPFADPIALLSRAKWAFTTRRVQRGDARGLSEAVQTARPGDLVLARVQTLGSHRRLQLPEGRPSDLYPGDLVVLACGARYATDQFEGEARLPAGGADLLAGGGCIGTVVARNALQKPATRLLPLGLVTGSGGRVLNLAHYALSPVTAPGRMPVIGVVGAAMNAGKTTATAAFVHGLTRAGWQVAAIKATGTGAFGDLNAYRDAGARHVADFTDCGLVSTYKAPLPRIRAAVAQLRARVEVQGAGIAVMEFADGLYQRETARLLEDASFRAGFAGWLFAAGDPLAAAAGAQAMAARNLPVMGISGRLSASPMASAEAEAVTGLPVLTRTALCDPATANGLALSAIARGKADQAA